MINGSRKDDLTVVLIPGIDWPSRQPNSGLTALGTVLKSIGAYVERARLPADDQLPAITVDWWQQARQQALSAVQRAEAATGRAATVAGTGLGGLVAVDLALEGLVHAVVCWQPDLDFPKLLDRSWNETAEHFVIDDEDDKKVLCGPYTAIQPIRNAVEQLRGRELPVPALLICDLSSQHRTDSRWLAAQQLRHLQLIVSASGDVTRMTAQGWELSDTVLATVGWLTRLPVRDLTAEPRVARRLVAPASSPPEGRGSIFVSYRHEPAAEQRAEEIRQQLLAAGFRVFLDRHSMRPTDIRELVHEVTTRDCSGGVIVLTKEIRNSEFVKRQEVPRLLAHAERHRMHLALDNTIRQVDNPEYIDPTAPLTLLDLPPGTIDNFTQYDMSGPADGKNYGIDTYVENLLAERLASLKNAPVYIDIQTYPGLQDDVPQNKAADLRIRVPLSRAGTSAARRQTNEAALNRLKLAFPKIGVALHAASPERIVVTGGGYFPVTFALGRMLCEQRLQCPVLIDDKFGIQRYGVPWGLPVDDQNGLPLPRHVVGEPKCWPVATSGPAMNRVAVLISGPKSNASLFGQFVRGQRGLAAACQISVMVNPTAGPISEPEIIKPAEGLYLATEIERVTTDFADRHRATEILMCFALGFPLAVLLGRRFNKYRVICCELDETNSYFPMIATSGVDSQVDEIF